VSRCHKLLFQQIDVFSSAATAGNPLALVHGADDLTDEQMAKIANWTNLSETAFLLKPTDPEADYRVRIWTPYTEMDFAGHPTLGSCFGWLCKNRTGKATDTIVQQCNIGLVRIRRDGNRLAFATPALRRRGPLDSDTLAKVITALGLTTAQVIDHQVVDNGAGWLGLLLDSAQSVLSVKPEPTLLAPLKVGIIGPYEGNDGPAFEVRAFSAAGKFVEDPVTGSLNAGLAVWMTTSGKAPDSYVVSQGTLLGRQGRLHVQKTETDVWIGGDCHLTIEGQIHL